MAHRTRTLIAAAGLLALAAAASACGGEEDAGTEAVATGGGATQTTSSDLLSNVPYAQQNVALLAAGGTSGDAVVFGSAAYFAYLRSDHTIGIIVEHDLGSQHQNFTTLSIFPSRWPQTGVALVTINNTMCLFFVSGNGLYMHRSTDGVNWGNSIHVMTLPGSFTFTTAPVAVAWSGQAILYVGDLDTSVADRTNIVQINVTTAGAASGPYYISSFRLGTNQRASATVWQNGLYLAWQDSLTGQVAMMHYTNAAGWSGQTFATGKVGIPSIYPVGAGALELVYRGNDAHLYRTFSTDGVSFGTAYVDTTSSTNQPPVQFSNWNLSANWVFFIGLQNGLRTALE